MSLEEHARLNRDRKKICCKLFFSEIRFSLFAKIFYFLLELMQMTTLIVIASIQPRDLTPKDNTKCPIDYRLWFSVQEFNLAFSTLIIYITIKHVISKTETPKILIRDSNNLRFYYYNTEETQSKSVFILIDVINFLLASVILLVIFYFEVDQKDIEDNCDFTNIALSNVVPTFAVISLVCGMRAIILLLVFVFLANKMT